MCQFSVRNPSVAFHLTQNKRQNPFSGLQSLAASYTLLSVTFSPPRVILPALAILATMFQPSILQARGFGTCSFLFSECSSPDMLTWLPHFFQGFTQKSPSLAVSFINLQKEGENTLLLQNLIDSVVR